MTRNPRETCGAGEGPCTQEHTHIHTHAHTVSLHPPVSNGLSDHLFNTVNKQEKELEGYSGNAIPLLNEYEHTELCTHVCSQVYTCPSVHTPQRKVESFNKT